MENNANVQFKTKFCNRWFTNPDGSYTLDFIKQRYLADHFAEPNQLVREKIFSVTPDQLYYQNFNNDIPTSVNVTHYKTGLSAMTINNFTNLAKQTNNLNRYRYIVAKSSAKVTTSNSELLPTNTTQTIIVIPFFEGNNTSHWLNDINITANQNGALNALGDNQIGVFDCDLPYSILYGLSTNAESASHVKFLHATNILSDGTTAQIPFFEIDLNYTPLIKLLSFVLYEKGFLGRLQYLINNSDKLLPETEPLFLAPNRYIETYNNGTNQTPLNTTTALFHFSWTRDQVTKALETNANLFDDISLYCYLLFNDNLYMSYNYDDFTNKSLSSWDNTETTLTTVGLPTGLISSSAAVYYANNVNTGLTQSYVRQSEESQAWTDYGFDTARSTLNIAEGWAGVAQSVLPWKVAYNSAKAAINTGKELLNIAQGAVDTAMTQQRANAQFRAGINNITSGASQMSSNPMIKALIPNKKENNSPCLFETAALTLHPYDIKNTMITYLNNGYVYNNIDRLDSFINRIYMNILNIDAYTNYDQNIKIILEHDNTYFNKKEFNDLFFNWLNEKHQVFNTPMLINVTDYTASDYYHNVEISDKPFIKIDISTFPWYFRTWYNGTPDEIWETIVKDNSYLPSNLWTDIEHTITVTDNEINISITAKNDSQWFTGSLNKVIRWDSNYMVYEGKKYILYDDILPTYLVTKTSKGYRKISYPLKNGDFLTIDWNVSANRNKLTEFVIRSTQPVTIPSDSVPGNAYLGNMNNLTYINLSGYKNVSLDRTFATFFANCYNLQKLDIGNWNVTQDTYQYFVFATNNKDNVPSYINGVELICENKANIKKYLPSGHIIFVTADLYRKWK